MSLGFNTCILLDTYFVVKNPFYPKERRVKYYYAFIAFMGIYAFLLNTLVYYECFSQPFDFLLNTLLCINGELYCNAIGPTKILFIIQAILLGFTYLALLYSVV